MRILGIDPGYAITGFSILEAETGRFKLVRCGAINTPAGMPFEQRLNVIYMDMNELLDTFKPDVMAIEELFFGQNVTTGIGVAQARGVVLLSAAQHDLTIHEYKPAQVKQSVVGYGNAEKKQMMEMTKRLLNLKEMPKPDDAADAIALSICEARASTSLLTRLNGG